MSRSLVRSANRALSSPSKAYASGITAPMAIWSKRQFSSAQGLSLPPPLSSLSSSGGSSGNASYFQRSQRLPTNTVVKFVPQQQAWVVERFGKFNRILDPGLAILIPLVDVSVTVHLLSTSKFKTFANIFDSYRESPMSSHSKNLP